jgi:release factor glutamine methyltransferase
MNRTLLPSPILALRSALCALRSAFWVRLWLRMRFLLFQRHRHDRLVIERVAGAPLVVLPEVLNPRLFVTGEFFAGALDARLIRPGVRVLDMGTGSGVCAVAAARLGADVVAIDVNPAAARCARINALLSGLERRIDVREGDLFAPVAGERFDVALFNPPYLRGTPRRPLDRALWAEDVVERYAAALPAHIAPGGCGLLLLSSRGDEAAFLEAFRAQGFAVEAFATRKIPGELLTIYKLTPKAEG